MIIQTKVRKERGAVKPAMETAAAVVNCLSKAMLSELKNLGKPLAGVDKETNACLIIQTQTDGSQQVWQGKQLMGK
jgi:hypothetical protein